MVVEYSSSILQAPSLAMQQMWKGITIMDPSISIDDAFAVWSEESADFMPPDEELAGGFCKVF